MHLNSLLLPDIIATLLLMMLLFAVRQRYQVTGTRGWILGIYFIFVEILAHAIVSPDLLMKQFLHTVALGCYAVAAVVFLYSATREKYPTTPRLIYLVPNTAILIALMVAYGFELKPPLYVVIALGGLLIGAVMIFPARLTVWHLAWHLFLWGPLTLLALQGDPRRMVYGSLFYLYATAGYAFYENLPPRTLGKAVMVTGFACWSIIFLAHPSVSPGPYAAAFDAAWNMQKFLIIVGMMVVLMEQQLSNKQWLAFHDELTALPNRRLFDDRLTQALKRTDRYGGQTALLMIDLNDFKLVNDRFGHQAGDEMLAKVALHLQNVLRQTDTVARIGGDEFGVIATGIANEAQVRHVTAKVTRALRTPIVLNEHGEVEVSGAVGVALYPADAPDGITLQAVADTRMYAHKRQRSFSQRVVNF